MVSECLRELGQKIMPYLDASTTGSRWKDDFRVGTDSKMHTLMLDKLAITTHGVWETIEDGRLAEINGI
jgi:hypothetical protein